LFSISVRSDRPVRCTSGPDHLKISDGVTACIGLVSAGGVDGSFFTARRALPWLPRHEQGDSNVTGGPAAIERKAAMNVAARVIAAGYIAL
jgi:hypothetical protein